VARSAFGFGQPIIRGSGEGDTRFFLDGIQVPRLFHFGIVSTYNSEALESVDLYPGGFGARYGGALGGIIEIIGKKPKTDRLHGYVDGNLFNASFMVEGPISKKLSFLATSRRSYVADMIDFAVTNILGYTMPFTVVPYYWDYIARFDYDPAKNHHCYLTFFGSKDRADIIFNEVRGGSSQVDENTNQMKQDVKFHMGILGWTWDINKRMKNDLRYALCYDDRGTSVFGIFKTKATTWAQYLRDQFSWSVSDAIKWNVGLDGVFIPYDINLTIPGASGKIEYDTAHYNLGPLGAYMFAEWKPTSRLELIPGIRFDYYPELDVKGSVAPEFFNYGAFKNDRGVRKGEPSARLSAKYKLDPTKKIKAAFGTYNETPQPQGQAIDTVWGNPKLHVSKASQWVIGYEWKLTDLISADVQAYYNRQWDLARTPSKNEISDAASRGNALPKFFDDGKARMEGLEIMLKHDQSKRFFGWLCYSLSRSERWDFDENRWAIYSSDQTHHVQLIGSMRFKGLQELGMRFQFVTGDPTTPILGPDYFDATNRRYVPEEGPVNSARVEPFISLDLRYEKKFTYKMWQLTAYLDITHVENLFGYGHKSPEVGGYIWNYDYTDKSMISDVTRPALGVKIDF
jgi:outer membrane receptor protein involved in Fe transport